MRIINHSCGPVIALWFMFVLVACVFLPHVVEAQDKPNDNKALEQSVQVDYLKQVKPLLASRCYACHGALKQQAGLRLDTVVFATRGGDSGPVIVPGDANKGLLLERVATTDVAERMPPEHEGEPLTREEIDLLRGWIGAGAVAPVDEKPEADPRSHWAFQPIVRPPVPHLADTKWVRNPIDAFVASEHQQRQLRPQAEATRTRLLRRLSLDLTGVPPTLEEIAACQNNRSPDWYEQTVQRLLSDPRHGQRWARHWMDIWRYSDWWGLGAQLRNSQPHIWHWRDWIVESLNDNLPYDEMVRSMLAADELYPQDLDKLRASGYLARNYFLFNRNQWMDETVEHVGKGFLGLTFNCAKCHDHKYDPITQTDYYRLRAFFEPYHVRIDMVPGEVDLTRDGIPRAFDGQLDTPTYRLIRGQESQPDKSAAITPGVPAMLAFKPLSIESITLPIDAWQPERRAWVLETYQSSARKNVASAEANLVVARRQLADAEQRQTDVLTKSKAKSPTAEGDTVTGAQDETATIVDKFAELDDRRWKLFGGEWVHQVGRLEQKKDGPSRAVARVLADPPRDFDATVQFTILGGSQWRSVGISFDATSADPSASAGTKDSEQAVYVSAYSAGPKVQASYHRGGKWQYPPEGMAAQPIKLDRAYTLRVQVRDTLINASLDGAPVIAWRSPLDRRDGTFQLTTFDALAIFHEVTVRPLKADTVLQEPGAHLTASLSPASAAAAVIEAKQAVHVAELAVDVAQLEVQSIDYRAAAMIAAGSQTSADATETQLQMNRSAARAERELVAARTRQAFAEAELRQLQAPPDKRDAATKAVSQAREALDKAVQRIEEPTEQFTRFSGAQWSVTRFRTSTADDPVVNFPALSTGHRKALADWMTDRRHPLTARVAVNHLWTRHFGTPLVPTMFDFGRNGTPPIHGRLLDWLASELIESGWNMKHMHRLIVESATYRMSSSAKGADANVAIDPDNIFFWRRAPTRLESQAVRDSLLALAGTLDVTHGGPPIPSANQNASPRRSLYFFHSNNERNLFLTTFDEALVKECYRREQSIVPQQALALINSALVLDAAKQIADRITNAIPIGAENKTSDNSFIRLAFMAILGEEPNATEATACQESLAAWKQLPEAQSGGQATSYARAQLVWVLLNHNDFVTIR